MQCSAVLSGALALVAGAGHPTLRTVLGASVYPLRINCMASILLAVWMHPPSC